MDILNLKNLNEGNKRDLPELVSSIVHEKSARALIKQELKQTENALTTLNPDQSVIRSAVEESLLISDAIKPINQYSKISLRILDTVPSDSFESINDFTKNDMSYAQSSLLNNRITREAMEAFKSSVPARTHATQMVNQAQSKTIKNYAKKVLYYEAKIKLYGIEYETLRREYEYNFSQIEEIAKKQKNSDLTAKQKNKYLKLEWEYLAKQVFLEFFILSSYTDKQLGVNTRTLEYLRKLYRQSLKQNKDTVEIEKILQDVTLFYDGARTQYSFFFDVVKKEMNGFRRWAKKNFKYLQAIENSFIKQVPLPSSKKNFIIKNRLLSYEEFLKNSGLAKLRELMTDIEKHYHSQTKNFDEVTQVNKLVHDFRKLISVNHFPVTFRVKHPLFQIIADAEIRINNVDALRKHYHTRNILKLFNAEGLSTEEFVMYYVLTGLEKLNDTLWTLRDLLLDPVKQEFLVNTLPGLSRLNSKEKNLIEAYKGLLNKIDLFISKINSLESNFSAYLSHFDVDVFSLLEDIADLITLKNLGLLLIPNLNREKINSLTEEAVKQQLSEIGIDLEHITRQVFSTIFRHSYVVEYRLSEYEGSQEQQERIDEIRSMLQDYFSLLRNLTTNLSDKEHSALYALVEKIYEPLNLPSQVEKQLDIDLKNITDFNKLLTEIFSFQSIIPNENIRFLKISFPEGRLFKGFFARNKDNALIRRSMFDRGDLINLLESQPDEIAEKYESILDIRNQDLLNIRGLLKDHFNGAGEKKYTQLYKAIAKMAIIFAESTGHGRPQEFYILPAKTGSFGFQISLEPLGAENNPKKDISWLLFALANYSQESMNEKVKIHVPLNLSAFEKSFADAGLASKILSPKLKALRVTQKSGLQTLHEQKMDDDFMTQVFSRRVDRAHAKEEETKAEMQRALRQQGNSINKKLRKILNYYGFNFSKNELNESLSTEEPVYIKKQIRGPAVPVKASTNFKTHPPLSEKKIATLTPHKAPVIEGVGQTAQFNLEEIMAILKTENQKILLEIDTAIYHTNPALVHEVEIASRVINDPKNPGEKLNVMLAVALKNPHKYKFVNETFRKIELSLTQKEIMDMPESIKDLTTALNQNPDNAPYIADLESERVKAQLLKWMSESEKSLNIQFMYQNRPIKFHHMAFYDTLQFNGLKPRENKLVRLEIQRADSSSWGLKITAYHDSYSVKLADSETKIGYAGQEKLKNTKPLIISIEKPAQLGPTLR